MSSFIMDKHRHCGLFFSQSYIHHSAVENTHSLWVTERLSKGFLLFEKHWNNVGSFCYVEKCYRFLMRHFCLIDLFVSVWPSVLSTTWTAASALLIWRFKNKLCNAAASFKGHSFCLMVLWRTQKDRKDQSFSLVPLCIYVALPSVHLSLRSRQNMLK